MNIETSAKPCLGPNFKFLKRFFLKFGNLEQINCKNQLNFDQTSWKLLKFSQKFVLKFDYSKFQRHLKFFDFWNPQNSLFN